MKFITITAIIIAACSAFLFRFQSKQQFSSAEQDIYAYHSQGIGYSDIAKLYSTDTAKVKSFFFKGTSLQKIDMNFSCLIKKTIIRSNAATLLVAYQVIDPALTIDNGNFPVNTVDICKELVNPVLVEMTNTGLVKKLQIDSTISDLSANMLKEMISRMQFVTSEKDRKSWQVTEENATGTFQANYVHISSDSSDIKYQKKNVGYSKTAFKKKEQKIITDNYTNIITNTSGKIKRIDASEAQVVVFMTDTITASGSKITIQLQSTVKVENEELATLQGLYQSPNYFKSTILSEELSEEKITRMAYKNTLKNSNWETLTQQLQVAATSGNLLQQDSLVLKFRALAYLYPATCNNMYQMLTEAAYNSYAYKVISQALASTETPAAINALVKTIYQRGQEESVLLDLMPVLATTSSPTDEAAILLKALAFDTINSEAVMATAQLALGGLAYHFRKIDKMQAELITCFMIDKMKHAKDTIQQLLVFGNTGDPLVFPYLKSYIYNYQVPDNVKEAAITAMWLIDNAEVSNLLTKLKANPNKLIASASKKAIVFRKEYFDSDNRAIRN